MTRTFLVLTFLLATLTAALAAKKNVLIIYGDSTHDLKAHNNTEVAVLLKDKIAQSKYADQFEVTLHYGYPKDQSMVEMADLIIISSDGGPQHALKIGGGVTEFTRMLDPVLKKKKTGLIVIHWATDAPSEKFAHHNEENARSIRWNGSVRSTTGWTRAIAARAAATIKPSKKEIRVNKNHPIANGVAESFVLNDEFYWNFFTEGKDSRNPKNDQVAFIHLADALRVAKRIPSTRRSGVSNRPTGPSPATTAAARSA